MSSTLILAVGQDSAILNSRSSVLRTAGYAVELSMSVKQAIERFRERHFDLVVLCHSLPLEDRLILVKLIRASGSQVPVLTVSPADFGSEDLENPTVGSHPSELLDGVEEVLTRSTRRSLALSVARSNLSQNIENYSVVSENLKDAQGKRPVFSDRPFMSERAKLRIFVVDDDAVIATTLALILNSQDYEADRKSVV